MSREYRVLVFPGSTGIALEIKRALACCKEVVLFSAGVDGPTHAPYLFARHAVVPSVNDPGWVEALNRILAEHRIDFVFPAHDDVVVALARHAGEIRARIVSSPPDTCLLTRSKRATYQRLSGVVPVPVVYDRPDAVPAYPVFVKPDRGEGSREAQIARNRRQLECLLEAGGEYLIMEHLPGAEYTIDCFSDRDAGLLFCGGRERVRTKGGICIHSRTENDPAFREYALAISRALPLHGAWFYQLKRDRQGQLKLLEVAPRIAGTMTVHRVQGVNFPLLSLYEQLRVPVEIRPNAVEVEVDRVLVSHYRPAVAYDTAYVDLDDTLILRGKVNVLLVRFLYQCVNAGVRLVLLTRHAGDVEETLRRHRLAGLFDEVLRLDAEGDKAGLIRPGKAILIDDSFRERKAVSEKCGIPTFDCSMIELLLDERA